MGFSVLFLISILNGFLMFAFMNSAGAKADFRELNEEIKITVINDNRDNKSSIFCHPGQTREWKNLWVNPWLQVTGLDKDLPPRDLASYCADNVSSVLYFIPRQEEYQFSPFSYSCNGFVSSESFVVHFHVTNPDLTYVCAVIYGIFIFFAGPSLSRSHLFHYGAGVMFGVYTSILIAVMIKAEDLPPYLGIILEAVPMLDGCTLLAWEKHLENYMIDFMKSQISLRYVTFAALVSFVIVYRFGPITDPRSLNLVRWSLQAWGLSLIYLNSQIEEASVAIILLVLAVYLSPRTVPKWIKSLWYRLFQRKFRFLTEDEYNREREEETQKALEKLREYCRNLPLHIVGQLSFPSRLIKFVSGEFHVTDEEIEEHNMFVESQDSKDVQLHPSQPRMPQTAELDDSDSKSNIVSC